MIITLIFMSYQYNELGKNSGFGYWALRTENYKGMGWMVQMKGSIILFQNKK